MSEQQTKNGLRDIAAAAEYLDVKFSWLRDAVTAERVPHTRIGKHVRFSQEHLDAIVAAGEKKVATVPTRSEVAARRVRSASRKTNSSVRAA